MLPQQTGRTSLLRKDLQTVSRNRLRERARAPTLVLRKTNPQTPTNARINSNEFLQNSNNHGSNSSNGLKIAQINDNHLLHKKPITSMTYFIKLNPQAPEFFPHNFRARGQNLTVTIGHLNIDRLRFKMDNLQSTLNTHKIHIMGITETWLDWQHNFRWRTTNPGIPPVQTWSSRENRRWCMYLRPPQCQSAPSTIRSFVLWNWNALDCCNTGQGRL